MKTLSMPYEDYQTDLLDMRKQGFNQAIRKIAKMLKLPESEWFSYLQNEFDSEAWEIAKLLGIEPDFTENDVPF